MDLAPAPEGFKWTYNRMTEPFEKQFNGVPQCFAAGGFKLLPANTATFLSEHTCVREDPFDLSRNLYAIVLDVDPGFGKPFRKNDVGPELLDRSGGDYVVRPSEPGIKTKSRLTQVGAGRGRPSSVTA